MRGKPVLSFDPAMRMSVRDHELDPLAANLGAIIQRSSYERYFKRPVDLVLVIVTAPAWLTLTIFLAGLIWITMRRPILFLEWRIGVQGRAFRLVKLRTMSDARDAQGSLLPDGKRQTRLGRILRLTSLDELPELWNVLRGEMSLVGPRPLPVRYLPRFTPEQNLRHQVLPGLTGWAQVCGRNSISWEEKFRLDVWYRDHLSPFVDLKILALTVYKVLKRDGINRYGAAMEEFEGTGGTAGPSNPGGVG